MKSTYSVQRDLMIVMRDGVRLAADLYLPPGPGPFPVLLERTPYNKRGTNPADRSAACPVPRSKPEVAAAFALAGYAYLLQDCRGRYGSEGVFSKYVNEHEDGLDTLAWIREQAWCDGRIGTLGLSYSAHVQAALAAGNPAGLAAMFLDSGGFSSAFHSGIRQGGAFELKQLTWAHKHALLSPLTLADAYRKAALQQVDIRAAVGVDPWQPGHSPLAAAPEYEGFVIEQWRHEVFDDYWKSPALYARGHYADWPDVPMVHLTGWFDPYALTATENFMGLAGRKRAPVHLVLGPWTHGQRSVTHAGEVDFGPAATLDGNIAPDYQALRQGWFDRHLKGDPLAADYLHAPVKLFVMGGGSGCRTREGRLDHGGQWRDEQEWPLQRALNLPFYFTPGGAMEHNVPQLHAAALEYDFDPTHPVPTIGGAIASGAPLMNAGAFDQRTTRAIFAAEQPYGPLADRPDVLVFQTEVLREPVEVTGQIVAHLWVSSSAPDTDFTVKLVDVYPPSKDYPDGCAINLAHGILRMRFRESFDQPRLMQPDDIYKIRIPCFPTSNRFAAGHRIRIDISSSNFPHFDINPNTGAPAGTPSTPVVARNRIHLDRDHPSHVVLPVVPR
ncbi:MAG TPA: CocE/NonD family hydrolase [Telluria sp.]|nr:CocE/NonD family hydrolase [Telluria sp.]